MIIGADGLVASTIGLSERNDVERDARHAVRFAVLDNAVAVRFDEPHSAALFASRYRDVPPYPEPGGIRTYVVRDASGHAHFWTDGSAGYMWPHGPLGPAATAFLADAVVMHALFRAIPSTVTFHAAALHHAGGAFAITGRSTAGKSTTAVACVAAGSELYSDERCIVTPLGTLPFPRAINLRRGGIDLLVADLPAGALRSRLERHRGADWENVHFAELFDARPLPAPAPLHAMFAISGREAGPRSRRITPVEMLPQAHFGAIAAETGIDRVRAILGALQGVACYELILGAPSASARHILDIVACGDGA